MSEGLRPFGFDALDLQVRSVKAGEIPDLKILVGYAAFELGSHDGAAVGGGAVANRPAAFAYYALVRFVAFEILALDKVVVIRRDALHLEIDFSGGGKRGVLLHEVSEKILREIFLVKRISFLVGTVGQRDLPYKAAGGLRVDLHFAVRARGVGSGKVSRQNYGLGGRESPFLFGNGEEAFGVVDYFGAISDVAVGNGVRKAKFASRLFPGEGRLLCEGEIADFPAFAVAEDHGARLDALHDVIRFHYDGVVAGGRIAEPHDFDVVEVVVKVMSQACGIHDGKVQIVDQRLFGAPGAGIVRPAKAHDQVAAGRFLEVVRHRFAGGSETHFGKRHLAVRGLKALFHVHVPVAFHIVRAHERDLHEAVVLAGEERLGAHAHDAFYQRGAGAFHVPVVGEVIPDHRRAAGRNGARHRRAAHVGVVLGSGAGLVGAG